MTARRKYSALDAAACSWAAAINALQAGEVALGQRLDLIGDELADIYLHERDRAYRLAVREREDAWYRAMAAA